MLTFQKLLLSSHQSPVCVYKRCQADVGTDMSVSFHDPEGSDVYGIRHGADAHSRYILLY